MSEEKGDLNPKKFEGPGSQISEEPVDLSAFVVKEEKIIEDAEPSPALKP